LTRDGGLSNGAKALAQIRDSKNAHGTLSNHDGANRLSKGAFSAEALKNIGFDPSANKQATDDAALKRKVSPVSMLNTADLRVNSLNYLENYKHPRDIFH
jgi:hypothetical protein